MIPAKGGRNQVLRLINDLLKQPRLPGAAFTDLKSMLEGGLYTHQKALAGLRPLGFHQRPGLGAHAQPAQPAPRSAGDPPVGSQRGGAAGYRPGVDGGCRDRRAALRGHPRSPLPGAVYSAACPAASGRPDQHLPAGRAWSPGRFPPREDLVRAIVRYASVRKQLHRGSTAQRIYPARHPRPPDRCGLEDGEAMTFLWPTMLIGLVLIPLVILAYAYIQRRRQRLAASFARFEGNVRAEAKRDPGFRRSIPAILCLISLVILLAGCGAPPGGDQPAAGGRDGDAGGGCIRQHGGRRRPTDPPGSRQNCRDRVRAQPAGNRPDRDRLLQQQRICGADADQRCPKPAGCHRPPGAANRHFAGAGNPGGAAFDCRGCRVGSRPDHCA